MLSFCSVSGELQKKQGLHVAPLHVVWPQPSTLCAGAAEAVLDALLEVKALDPLILLRQQGLRKATHQATAGGEGALVSPETAVLW